MPQNSNKIIPNQIMINEPNIIKCYDSICSQSENSGCCTGCCYDSKYNLNNVYQSRGEYCDDVCPECCCDCCQFESYCCSGCCSYNGKGCCSDFCFIFRSCCDMKNSWYEGDCCCGLKTCYNNIITMSICCNVFCCTPYCNTKDIVFATSNNFVVGNTKDIVSVISDLLQSNVCNIVESETDVYCCIDGLKLLSVTKYTEISLISIFSIGLKILKSLST